MDYSLDQLPNRLAIVEQILRPAVEVGKLGIEVDAERLIDRRHDVLEIDVSGARAFGAGIGFADDLAHAEAAAAEQHAAGVGPVLAPRPRLADARRPAKLAEHD